MSNSISEFGSAESKGGALPMPEPKLLKPHLIARHDLIPLSKPNARRADKPIGKAPRDSNWRNRDYSGQNPSDWMLAGNNVGVRLRDNQLVIDVDPRNFGGSDRFAELCATFGIRPDNYPRIVTGGGGQHIYMTKPADLKTREKLVEFPGLEFKTIGRQLVAAGSVHPETHRHYRADDWLSELGSPPAAPDNLLQAISSQSSRTKTDATSVITPEQLETFLSVLIPSNYSDRREWLELMMACHDATKGQGVDEFVAWSILDPEYTDDAAEIRKEWQTLSSNRVRKVTARTLFKAVVDAGHRELVATFNRTSVEQDFANLPATVEAPDLDLGRFGRPATTLANCLKLLRHANLGFAFDELSRRPLLRAETFPWSIDIGREVNDETTRVIRHYLIEAFGMEFSKENVIEACLTLARQSPYNPVVDYLASLQWDGTARLDNWLVRYLGATDSEYIRAIGRLGLVGAVRRARKPGCKFDQVLILEGAQGSGKSSALKILGGDWHSDAELGRLDSKEAALVLQGVWIHELGELTAMGRSEVEDLKAFVSRCEDRFRAPYDRMARSEPRRCMFIGTTNAETYLFDMTGNRRFWPVKTHSIDLVALKNDRDQLWAEASAAEAAGETIELSSILWPIAAEEQASRLADDPWRDQIMGWLEASYDDATPSRFSFTAGKLMRVHTRDIMECALEIEPGRRNQAHAKRLREVMRSIGGWEYKRGLRIEGAGSAAGYQRVEP